MNVFFIFLKTQKNIKFLTFDSLNSYVLIPYVHIRKNGLPDLYCEWFIWPRLAGSSIPNKDRTLLSSNKHG